MSDRVQAPFYAPFAVGGPNAQAVGMPPMVLTGTIPSETGPRKVLVVVTEQGLEIHMPGGQRLLLPAENGAVFPSSMGFNRLCHTANTRPVPTLVNLDFDLLDYIVQDPGENLLTADEFREYCEYYELINSEGVCMKTDVEDDQKLEIDRERRCAFIK